MASIKMMTCDKCSTDGKPFTPAVERLRIASTLKRKPTIVIDLCDDDLAAVTSALGMLGGKSKKRSNAGTGGDGKTYKCRFCSVRLMSPQGRAAHERSAHPKEYRAAKRVKKAA